MEYLKVEDAIYPSEIFVIEDFFCPEYSGKHLVLKSAIENDYILFVIKVNGINVDPLYNRIITKGFKHEANFIEMPLIRFNNLKTFL